jgi:hypothetical protein
MSAEEQRKVEERWAGTSAQFLAPPNEAPPLHPGSMLTAIGAYRPSTDASKLAEELRRTAAEADEMASALNNGTRKWRMCVPPVCALTLEEVKGMLHFAAVTSAVSARKAT